VSNRIRSQIDAALRSSDREYAAQKNMFVPWDLSKNPGANLREEKLGFMDSTHGMAILDFDPETSRNTLADGLNKKSSVTAYRPMEPDNWVLRLHGLDGRGIDNVWALRMQTEHDRKRPATSRGHRSTIWVDQ